MEETTIPVSRDDLIITISFLSPGYLLAAIVLCLIDFSNHIAEEITPLQIALFLVAGLIGSVLMYGYSFSCFRLFGSIARSYMDKKAADIIEDRLKKIKKMKLDFYDFSRCKGIPGQVRKNGIDNFTRKWAYEIYTSNPAWMYRIRRNYYLANCYFSLFSLFCVGIIVLLFFQIPYQIKVLMVFFLLFFSVVCLENMIIHSKEYLRNFFDYEIFTRSRIH